jgi:DNA modification methylase
MAARKLGLTDVPCIKLSHLTPTQRKAYVIADNQLALNAGWNEELLTIELDELLADNFALEVLGFDPDELKRLMSENEVTQGLTDEDQAPEVEDNPVTKLGDVWVLGKHRLMCGDSTSIEQAEKLMDGVKADMVFTDPPYNVAYEGRGEKNKLGKIKNDDMSDESFEQFCRDVFATYHAVMKPLACIYVCHPDSQTGPKLAFEKTFGELFKKASTLIWVKQSAGMGWQDYRAQHEPILYGWKEGGSGKHFYCGDRSKTTVWQIGRDAQASYVHPTQKPVALPEEAIKNSSKGEDVVLDLFGGSGSTLIACEKTGRINRSMELDPKYCDVIIKRWQDFTGKQAVLESSGQTFAELKNAQGN